MGKPRLHYLVLGKPLEIMGVPAKSGAYEVICDEAVKEGHTTKDKSEVTCPDCLEILKMNGEA